MTHRVPRRARTVTLPGHEAPPTPHPRIDGASMAPPNARACRPRVARRVGDARPLLLEPAVGLGATDPCRDLRSLRRVGALDHKPATHGLGVRGGLWRGR